MKVNEAGMSIADSWAKLPCRFPSIRTDAFIVMPNHVHGIIVIVGADHSVCPPEGAAEDGGSSVDVPASLPEVVQWFKTVTTNAYTLGVKERGWPAYAGKLWQRNYYEHIIRNEISLSQIRTYIRFNPHLWAHDKENPAREKALGDDKALTVKGERLTDDELKFDQRADTMVCPYKENGTIKCPDGAE